MWRRRAAWECERCSTTLSSRPQGKPPLNCTVNSHSARAALYKLGVLWGQNKKLLEDGRWNSRASSSVLESQVRLAQIRGGGWGGFAK